MLTIKQAVRALENIADAHRQINDFVFGEPPEYGESDQIIYPFCGAFIARQRTERGVLFREWTLYVGDLITSDKSNETEVMSDCERIILGVFSQFKNYLENNQATLLPEAALETFRGEWDDNLTGFQLTFTTKQSFPADPCKEPSTYDPEREESGDVRIYNSQTGATITTINAGGEYGVLQFSGIHGGSAGTVFTNSIVAG